MNTELAIRNQVKKYIDKADFKIVKMVHAMLEVESDNHIWDNIPESVENDIQLALSEIEAGSLITHEDAKKQYKKWIVE